MLCVSQSRYSERFQASSMYAIMVVVPIGHREPTEHSSTVRDSVLHVLLEQFG